MRASSIVLIAAALTLAIAFLGQFGPLTAQLKNISTLTLILGVALAFGGVALIAKEKRLGQTRVIGRLAPGRLGWKPIAVAFALGVITVVLTLMAR